MDPESPKELDVSPLKPDYTPSVKKGKWVSYTKKRKTEKVVEDIEDEEGNVTTVKVLWHGEDKPSRKRSDPGLLTVVPIDLDNSQYYSAPLG